METLTYFTDAGRREARVNVYHVYGAPLGMPDFHVIRLADTEETVGEGDTLAEAVSDAQIRLHQRDDFGTPVGAYS